jgi:hypothetical protein
VSQSSVAGSLATGDALVPAGAAPDVPCAQLSAALNNETKNKGGSKRLIFDIRASDLVVRKLNR